MSDPVTMLDIARRSDPNGGIATIAEMLTETNEILIDMPWLEGNQGTMHKTTVRTGLPEPTWRKLNYGVQPGKSTTTQVTDACGMLENYAEIDKDLADLNGNTRAWRLSEDRAFIEGMNQEMAKMLFYGDTSKNPEKILGLTPRFAATSTTKTKIGYNVLTAGGTGSDNTSIWLVGWGPNTVHGIYPKGLVSGLQTKDLDEQTLFDANNGRYQGYRTHYKWNFGLCVRDWRYIVRVANVDVSDLDTAGDSSDSSPNLFKLMIKALNRIPVRNLSRLVFYANSDVMTAFEIKLLDKSNVYLSTKDITGAGGITRDTITFRGIPVRRCDQIANDETLVA
jgi:hypothetical protein